MRKNNMNGFPSIEEINEILDEITLEIPNEFFRELNEGIVLLPEFKVHKKSKENAPLYILGEYHRSITGRHIKIYYGSFKKVYDNRNIDFIRKRLKETLLHEFTHHLESLAGESDLEKEDMNDLREYLRRWH
jgi:predicted Zn-dependent protease with MMP-like domain